MGTLYPGCVSIFWQRQIDSKLINEIDSSFGSITTKPGIHTDQNCMVCFLHPMSLEKGYSEPATG